MTQAIVRSRCMTCLVIGHHLTWCPDRPMRVVAETRVMQAPQVNAETITPVDPGSRTLWRVSVAATMLGGTLVVWSGVTLAMIHR